MALGQNVYQVAAGSVAGTDHTRSGKNNQDAWAIRTQAELAIAVVCDGCGSSPGSEVGSRIGAALAVEGLWRELAKAGHRLTAEDSPAFAALLERVRQGMLAQLRVLASAMGPDLAPTVRDHFLFTLVAAALTPEAAMLFSIGDGIVACNGRVEQLGPFEENRPPYLGYGLLTDGPRFKINLFSPATDVESLLVGTDGVSDLMDAHASVLPGKTEQVGAISQFWSRDLFFKNSDALRRRLALMNRESFRPDWDLRRVRRQKGLLRDDTTLVVIRQAPEEDGQ